MSAFHDGRRVYPRPDQAPFEIRARVPGRPHVGAVIGIHVGGVVDFLRFCKGDQPFHHFVIVRAVTVFDTDRDLRFFTGEIGPHAAHIYGEKLVGVFADRRRAVPYFLIIGKIEIGVILGLLIFLFHCLQHRQKADAPRFVVEKSRLHEAAFRHRRLGIEGDHAARAYPQRGHFRRRRHFFVQAHVHGRFGAFERARVLIDVAGTGIGKKGARINFSAVGIYAAVFSVKRRQDRPPEPGKAYLSVGGNASYHRAERIDVRRNGYLFIVLFALDGHFYQPFVGRFRRIPRLCEQLCQLTVNFFGKPRGTVHRHNRFQSLDDKFFISFRFCHKNSFAISLHRRMILSFAYVLYHYIWYFSSIFAVFKKNSERKIKNPSAVPYRFLVLYGANRFKRPARHFLLSSSIYCLVGFTLI